jgi:hypothetical protein
VPLRLFGHRPPVVGGLAKHPLSFRVFGLIGQLIALGSFGAERFRSSHSGAPFLRRERTWSLSPRARQSRSR